MPLAPGTRLGPYEIESLVGAGGMGEVYKARDPRLCRDVAIKVLPQAEDPLRLHRFEQEARAVAALTHPNVLAIFDVGIGTPPFLVTELLDGETLRVRIARGPLEVSAILDIGRQCLSGLAAAHARGFVHRDLKPENIFVTREGIVKILDFGLAKAITTDVVRSSDVDETTTADDHIVGTAGYMAPEQIRGATIDHRCDIFAIGVVLYEMVTRQRAFHGDSRADIMSAVLREQPASAPLDAVAPPALARIIRRCLEKSPADRFQSAMDLRFALEAVTELGVRTSASTLRTGDPLPSIAVLPFTDMSAQRDQAYFCEGMAEEIINALARVEGLRIAPRTSTFQARSSSGDLNQIAHTLGVRHLLEGSVRTAGQRLRVTAQVIDVDGNRAIWSDRFDGVLADVFDIQDAIAARIVTALQTRLVGESAPTAVRRQYTPTVEAYQAYLQGRHHRYTTYNLVAAIEAFTRAATLDPGYAEAHVNVASVATVLANFAFWSPATAHTLSRQAIQRALAIDQDLPVAHATLGWWTSLHERNWLEAERLLKHAISLDASCLEANAFLGMICAALQRGDEAAAWASRLVQLDPLSPWTHGVSALIFHVIGRSDEGLRESRTALDLRADSIIALWCAGMSLRSLERHNESIASLEHAVELMPRGRYLWCELAVSYARGGFTAKAEETLRRLDEQSPGTYDSPLWRAAVTLSLGRIDDTFDLLERAYVEGAPTLPFLGAGWWDPVREDPRFIDLARRIGVPPTVTQPRIH